MAFQISNFSEKYWFNSFLPEEWLKARFLTPYCLYDIVWQMSSVSRFVSYLLSLLKQKKVFWLLGVCSEFGSNLVTGNKSPDVWGFKGVLGQVFWYCSETLNSSIWIPFCGANIWQSWANLLRANSFLWFSGNFSKGWQNHCSAYFTYLANLSTLFLGKNKAKEKISMKKSNNMSNIPFWG